MEGHGQIIHDSPPMATKLPATKRREPTVRQEATEPEAAAPPSRPQELPSHITKPPVHRSCLSARHTCFPHSIGYADQVSAHTAGATAQAKHHHKHQVSSYL